MSVASIRHNCRATWSSIQVRSNKLDACARRRWVDFNPYVLPSPIASATDLAICCDCVFVARWVLARPPCRLTASSMKSVGDYSDRLAFPNPPCLKSSGREPGMSLTGLTTLKRLSGVELLQHQLQHRCQLHRQVFSSNTASRLWSCPTTRRDRRCFS